MRRITTVLILVTLIGSTAVCAQNTDKDGHPNLKETLQWMHTAFPDSESNRAFHLGQTRELNFVEGKGDANPSCTVTIIDHWKAEGKPVTRDIIIDLSLIDPESIKWYVDDISEKDMGTVTLVATDDKKIIAEKMENKEDDKTFLTEREFFYFITPQYAQRFAKAFLNAVTICGGEKSAF